MYVRNGRIRLISILSCFGFLCGLIRMHAFFHFPNVVPGRVKGLPTSRFRRCLPNTLAYRYDRNERLCNSKCLFTIPVNLFSP